MKRDVGLSSPLPGAGKTGLMAGLRVGLVVIMGLSALIPRSVSAKDWSIAIYGGWLTSNNAGEIFQPGKLDIVDSYLGAVAISRSIGQLSDNAGLALEGQAVRHFRRQDHWEFNGLSVVRWTAFPWDDFLDTSAAAGLGLSYATKIPEVEAELDGNSERLLAYWMLELEASIPKLEAWHVLGRLHHRSPAYGLFGESGGSNVLSLGLRYRF
jgi:hypothetical protein